MVNSQLSPEALPYVPYRTFQTFLGLVKADVPARIDRSFWGERFSGSTGTQLTSSLRALRLIDAEANVSAELENLAAASGTERKRLLRDVLKRTYAPLFRLNLERATRAQFNEAFAMFGIKPKVQPKCEAFFIRAAVDAGVDLSQHILKGRHTAARAAAPAADSKPPSGESALSSTDRLKLELAEMILRKYPDFDASWSPAVQEQWLKGMHALHGRLSESLSS